MWEQNSRYTEFGNSIISRYCGLDTYYDPITLLFPRMHEETEEPAEQPQYTNIYQLWYLKEENHIYERKLTFLTNLLEKNVYNHAVFSIEQQVKTIIENHLPQLEGSVMKQLTNETAELLRNEKNELRREELTIRLLADKYKLEKETAEKLYTNLVENTRTYIIGRNTDAWNVHESGKSDYHAKDQNLYQNKGWGHERFSSVRQYSQVLDITNRIRQMMVKHSSEYHSGSVWQYQTVNENKNNWYQNQNLIYSEYLSQSNIEQTEQTAGDITEIQNAPLYRSNTENINQIQHIKTSNPFEFYSSWMNRYQTELSSIKNSWYQYESLTQPVYLTQRNIGQTEISVGDITDNRSYTEHVNYTLQRMIQNPLEFYNSWISQYQTDNNSNILYKNENSWYRNELTTSEDSENKSYTENIKQIQQIKISNPLEFYSSWMNRFQSVNKNENSWYRTESFSNPVYLSQWNNREIEIIENDVTKNQNVSDNRSYSEAINEIQQIKMKNPLEFYSNWMSRYLTVNQYENSSFIGNRNYLENGSFTENRYDIENRSFAENRNDIENRSFTENQNFTASSRSADNVNQIQQSKRKDPLNFYSNWMNRYQSVYENTNNWYQSESFFKPVYLSEVKSEGSPYLLQPQAAESPPSAMPRGEAEPLQVTGGDITGKRNKTETINHLQQMKLINPLEFYSSWMSQNQTFHTNESNWYRNESSSNPIYLSTVNIDQLEINSINAAANRDRLDSIRQMQQRKTGNPLEFYSSWMNQYQTVNRYENNWYQNESVFYPAYLSSVTVNQSETAAGRNFAPQIGPVIRSSEVNLIYEANGNKLEQEKAQKDYRQVVETQKQVQKEIEFIKETRHEVDQLHQTYQRLENKQKKDEDETIRLNSERGKQYIQQEAEKVFEIQLNESINHITGKVYRKLEERLRTERGRRGMI